ncbi:hypothetical protein PENSPDRAFT_338025 [Peniophora sp. CONT]|nr:hypothetical protein PENSPDRAFT_338025 [Peniophora sp. CONT]
MFVEAASIALKPRLPRCPILAPQTRRFFSLCGWSCRRAFTADLPHVKSLRILSLGQMKMRAFTAFPCRFRLRRIQLGDDVKKEAYANRCRATRKNAERTASVDLGTLRALDHALPQAEGLRAPLLWRNSMGLSRATEVTESYIVAWPGYSMEVCTAHDAKSVYRAQREPKGSPQPRPR